ncbi:dethiobiotin synthetase [Onishia taeanensis]|uniref:ATP-dependent dethiobiotin synthetase BioD n=1 Tax=Onishia taeanensis TaxID=284577 RepID=A0A1G7TWB6_9GAMM|nr:dethiobiotin synthase [Halomonas taeanensis]MAX31973.1 dethiobiotin synthase [Halomonadaceae bacterium]SDG39596.1 dethiobiotin synthetase [Halomonas taeanensis]
MATYFITGTDTDAGKTLVTAGLLALARRQGLTTLGLKPVASGCDLHAEGLRNEDALALQARSYPDVDYATINPFAYAPAIAPHLAARQAGDRLHLATLTDAMGGALALKRDLTLIEGAGGWRVPLNDNEDLSDLAGALQVPVILVVGLRLGCINHARLTAEAISAQGLRLAGWVANGITTDFDEADDNLASLAHHLPAPCLGRIPYLTGGPNGTLPEQAASRLKLPNLP